MTIEKPFRRTCRRFRDGTLQGGRNDYYIDDDRFAKAPQQYVRAFMVIQKDLLELFDYVEPADKNLCCYSYRTHELLMRSCVEVEANFKAILSENGYIRPGDLDTRDVNGYSQPGKNWNRKDYKKLNVTHRLSSYQVKFPVWHGDQAVRTPFSSWAHEDGGLTWYDAYNATKHDRQEQFEQANFTNLLEAIAGLVVLLASQFYNHDFSYGALELYDDLTPQDGLESAIGRYFRVKYPDWPNNERYAFEWQQLKNDPNPFRSLEF